MPTKKKVTGSGEPAPKKKVPKEKAKSKLTASDMRKLKLAQESIKKKTEVVDKILGGCDCIGSKTKKKVEEKHVEEEPEEPSEDDS